MILDRYMCLFLSGDEGLFYKGQGLSGGCLAGGSLFGVVAGFLFGLHGTDDFIEYNNN